MSSLPAQVQLKCESILAAPILNIKPLFGGDIHDACLIETANASYFIKLNTHQQAFDMFQTEQKGLQLLAQNKDIKTPCTIAVEQVGEASFLLMDYVEPGEKTDTFWEQFGTQLAQFHRNNTASNFGLDHHNYIGSLNQYNHPASNWSEFYIEHRLKPQLKLAVDQRRMPGSTLRAFNQLFTKLDQLCPLEPATLTHGDLWSGNFLAGKDGTPFLIDPAVAYVHREMDLGMSHLFGGFSPTFYAAYEEHYPLSPGFDERKEIYQLYYLLVHVNLFGVQYLGAVQRIVEKYS